MKKILLTLAGAMSIAAAANAQLADGSVFPDFTRTDIYGNSHHLYGDLAAGKTVIIDVSATWCHPCWVYHQSGALDSVWAKHGPAGEPGVDAGTTNDMVVYFVQGEPTSGLAELTNNTWGTGAVTSGGTYATFTQGNWVQGSHYYIIDDSTAQSAYNTSWHIAFFPTVYMICQDRLVRQLTQPTEAEAYAAALSVCPSTPPSSTVDAKAVTYTGANYFVCNGTPTVRFQNYSATTTITSATITVKDQSGATVATVPWTGSVAPLAIANVTVPSFVGTSFSGYKYSVSVIGDSNTGNDASEDSLFKVYTPSVAGSIPASENFEASVPFSETFSTPDGYMGYGALSASQIGADGTATKALIYEFYQSQSGTVQEYVLGNYNVSSAATVGIQFDLAYAQYNTSSNDALAVKVSTDCGATWTTAFSQAGATMSTSAATTSEFIPTAASMWKHVSVQTPGGSSNMVIKFVGTSNYGNDLYVDNIKVANATAISEVSADKDITIAPNPATDNANIFMTLNNNANVQVQVIDALGRVVSSSNQDLKAGAQKIEVSTAAFAAGVYNVRIVADGVVAVKQLSVVK